ncbi:MAG: hypothetical protein PHP83_01805 [Clostridia bacterium]|nr:hypothetical protein [Clostridia bacterium]
MKLFLFGLANSFLNKGVLLATVKPEYEVGASKYWVVQIANTLKSIVSPALIIMSAVGAIYSIVLGVKMAQADDQSKRDEAKKNLINVIISVVAVILLIVIFYMLSNWLIEGTIDPDDLVPNVPKVPEVPKA